MWTKEKYNNLIQELYNQKDDAYATFSSSLLNNNIKLIGVRIPILRDIAKKISKTNIEEYLKYYKGNTEEEILLLGLSIAYTNNKEIYDKYLELYSKEITDWQLCDVVANTLKLIKKENDYFYPFVLNMLNKDNEFQVRFGLVILLNYYLNDNYIDKVINNILNINTDKYYINMALSWLICEIYIKYPIKIDKYLNNKYFNKFVINKSISKINDSYRITQEVKQMLKERRIK